MTNPAHDLRATREQHGVTLEEVAARTKISRRHLEELERGDISRWPPGVYARSWARAYAAESGIEPERVLEILAPVAGAPSTEGIPAVETLGHTRSDRDAGSSSRSLIVVAIAVALALLALFVWRMSSPAASPEVTPAGAPPAASGTVDPAAPAPAA